jgi:hypothetical protein
MLAVALFVQGAEHGAAVGAFAVGRAGIVRLKSGDIGREFVETHIDLLFLAQPIEFRCALAQGAQQQLPARLVAGLVLDGHAAGMIADDQQHRTKRIRFGRGQRRPYNRQSGQQKR